VDQNAVIWKRKGRNYFINIKHQFWCEKLLWFRSPDSASETRATKGFAQLNGERRWTALAKALVAKHALTVTGMSAAQAERGVRHDVVLGTMGSKTLNWTLALLVLALLASLLFGTIAGRATQLCNTNIIDL